MSGLSRRLSGETEDHRQHHRQRQRHHDADRHRRFENAQEFHHGLPVAGTHRRENASATGLFLTAAEKKAGGGLSTTARKQ